MNKLTYISLFSSAGVGCYGFKQEGFNCIATNELISRRLQVQKDNDKCKYESGYICGDILKKDTKDKIYAEIDLWKRKEKIEDILEGYLDIEDDANNALRYGDAPTASQREEDDFAKLGLDD